jgi:Electron transfer DM13
MQMKMWIKVAVPVAAIAGFLAWYAFRPERLLINRQVDEALPTAQGGSSPQPLEYGQFYGILHPTAGTATIYQMGDGTRLLRFTGFRTSNGPDVHVYMVAADDAKDAAAVRQAGFVDLGVIKGNIGDQNYKLATSLDLAKYRAVSIWCKRFSVNFGAAALRPTETSQNH